MASDTQPPGESADAHCTDVERFLRIIQPDGVYEIRVIDCPDRPGGSYVSTASGYYNDAAVAAKAIKQLESLEPPAIYVSVNPVTNALLARAANRIVHRSKKTTAKPDVVRRRWLFVDIDALRPSGISSADDELAGAMALSDTLLGAMSAEGWPEPLRGMSGNGAYLFWRIDLANDNDAESLVQRVLIAMAKRFNTDLAEVDLTPFDANRICKVLGTVARKGDALVGVDGEPDRPHRRSWFIDPDGDLELVTCDQLIAVAESIDDPEPAKQTKSSPVMRVPGWDADRWLRDHNVPVANPMPYQGGRKWLFTDLPKCCEAHGHGFDGSSCIIERADGMMGASCHHNHCDWGWRELRLAYEPDAFARENVDISGIVKGSSIGALNGSSTGSSTKSSTGSSPDDDDGGGANHAANPVADVGPSVRPKLICMADVEPRPVRWLWQDRIAAGRVSMVVGMPGLGKSFLSCDMAARVTTGRSWPDGAPCERGSVLFITCEDDPGDTIRPRLDAHGADVSRVHLLAGSLVRDPKTGDDVELMFSLAEVAILEAALDAVKDCRLIVIDPIGSFLGGRTDAHRDNEVRGVLAPVAMLAERSGAAVLMVAHRRKSNGGSADDSALGSRAFTGLARAVWHLSADPDDDERRLWLPGKNNLAKRASGLAFRIVGPGAEGRVDWETEPVGMSADDAMARERAGDDGERTAIDEAAAWLNENLDENGRTAKEIKRSARADGIKERTLDRAADRLGVVKGPDGFGGPWLWRFPCAVSPSLPSVVQSRQGETFGETDKTVARLWPNDETADRETGYL